MRGLEFSGYPILNRDKRHSQASPDFHRGEVARFDHAADGTGRHTAKLLGSVLETEQQR